MKSKNPLHFQFFMKHINDDQLLEGQIFSRIRSNLFPGVIPIKVRILIICLPKVCLQILYKLRCEKTLGCENYTLGVRTQIIFLWRGVFKFTQHTLRDFRLEKFFIRLTPDRAYKMCQEIKHICWQFKTSARLQIGVI